MTENIGIDNDLLLALQLQENYDNEHSFSLSDLAGHDEYKTPAKNGATDTWSLVDPRWETLDPIPDVRGLFMEFNTKYFCGKLAGVEVRWSPRMTLCAGVCVYEGQGGLCSVRLSQPLLKLRPRKDLIETLLHEMIHAYLFVTDNNKDHDGHGPEFQKHMNRLNKETGTTITIYHSFHDEVENYRQHWWRCDGPCQKKRPYFGFVKRAMNRPPSARDPWWRDHQATCGGAYEKIKEPEGYKDKKNKKPKKDKEPEKTKGTQDIRSFWDKSPPAVAPPSASYSKLSKSNSDNKPSTSNSDSKPSTSSTATTSTDRSIPTLISSGGVGKNVHGLDGKFGSTDNDEDQQSVSVPKHTFPGQGTSLGRQTADGRGPIVRRLPGIGVISSERPVGQNSLKPAVIDYVSDDSDFDHQLDDMLKPPVRKKKKKKDVNQGIPDVGNCKKIPGLTSVSNKNRGSGSRTSNGNQNLRDFMEKGAKSNDGKSLKRKISNDDTFAMDRNKRACYISSSDNDSEIDENMTLGSVVRRKSLENEQKSSIKSEYSTNVTSRDSSIDSRYFFPGEHQTVDLTRPPARPSAVSGPPARSSAVSGPPAWPSAISGPPARPSAVSGLPDWPSAVSGPPSWPSAVSGPPARPAVVQVSDPLRECPVCMSQVPESTINRHLDLCLGAG